MTARRIPQRVRFFLAVEGDGEQSFVKWMGQLAEEANLHIHLDCQPLGGGGYSSMLANAVLYNKKKKETKGKPKTSILLVDSDRAAQGDGWTIAKLRAEADREKFIVCVQMPNQEGLLLRMLPGNERLNQDATGVKRLLRSAWPEYQKPVDAGDLASKFTLGDLQRVAGVDTELRGLLQIIGLL